MNGNGSLPEREWFKKVRRERPLIHCITNYVTAGDMANVILAVGASPVMADGLREAEDIARLSKALVLNIGTLREPVVDTMLAAGKLAASLGHPVIFDPVGAGASAFRTETALRILREVPCSVVRGNASEIRTLARYLAKEAGHSPVHSRGVDADEREKVTEENRESTVGMLRFLSRKTGAVIVMTGEQDLIVDGERVCLIRNGHEMMSRITGTGCMMDGVLAALMAASDVSAAGGYVSAEEHLSAEGYVSVEECISAEGYVSAEEHVSAEERISAGEHLFEEERFLAVVHGVAAHGICGELAYRRLAKTDGGTGSFRVFFMDAYSRIEDKEIWEEIRYEV